MRARRLLIVALIAAAPAGCGSEEARVATETTADRPARPDKLPAGKQRRVFEAQQAITAYCARRDLSLHGGRRPPSAAKTRRAYASADRLAALARARPFDLVQTGVDTTLYVGDLIEDLGNLDCDPELVGKLEAAVG